MKKIDDIFEWKGWGNGFGSWDSKCRVRVYHNQDGEIDREVAVITELKDNKGTSITNCIEFLTVLLVNKYELTLNKLTIVEHYEAEHAHRGLKDIVVRDETFSVVGFSVVPGPPSPLAPKERRIRLCNPTWKRIKKEHLDSLIGERFEP